MLISLMFDTAHLGNNLEPSHFVLASIVIVLID
jgi:hypothetical protein